jgi:hypothetical protein
VRVQAWGGLVEGCKQLTGLGILHLPTWRGQAELADDIVNQGPCATVFEGALFEQPHQLNVLKFVDALSVHELSVAGLLRRAASPTDPPRDLLKPRLPVALAPFRGDR